MNEVTVIPESSRGVLLRPLVSADDLLAAQDAVTTLIRKALKDGVDYGVIPGAKQPMLMKAGAERLTKAFGTTPVYEIVQSEVDHDRKVNWEKKKYGKVESGTALGLYRYVVRCSLRTNGGVIVGDGIGSCSSLEAKYCDRPRELENTILKMAQKRALVGATLNAFGLSDRFSQDLDDVEQAPTNGSNSQTPSNGFDGKNSGHRAALEAQLRERGIDAVVWPEISRRMQGRPSAELDRVVQDLQMMTQRAESA